MKTCSKCKEQKEFSEFARSNQTSDGHHYWCKSCHKTVRDKWIVKNKEKLAVDNKRYYEKNKQKIQKKERKRRKSNPEKTKEKDRLKNVRQKEKRMEWERKQWESNPEYRLKKRERKRKYTAKNREHYQEYNRSYQKLNKASLRENSARRRASEKNASPPWLTEDQLKEMKDIYWLAVDLKAVTGENYHVDHIVPLQGKNVCGLHVPWNLQVLPADINIGKGNRYDTHLGP